jgi:serine protease Do
VAIGSPRGLDWTVTQGIVSATHRVRFNSRTQAGVEDFIQTDTAINPGNSGGPLLNLKGEVIGMNSLIMSQNQGSEGLGFAIPSNLVKKVVKALIRDGKVTRGDLGIETQDINDSIRRGLKLSPDTRGVVVTQAVPLGPAAEAALTVGDVIASFQESPVLSSAQLNRLTAAASPGTSVTLGIVRNGARSTLRLSVVDQLALMTRRAESPGYGLLGIRVEPVSSSIAKSVGLSEPSGVLVVEVVPGSPADNVNIAKGDIIFRVDGASVGDQEEFRQRVGEAIQTGNVVVLLRDGPSGRTGFMVIPIR